MPNWSGASTIPGTHFGQSVASAGDVNGDGYADLVIGEPREFLSAQNGRAQVYYGNGGAGIALRPQQRRKDDTGPVSANGMTDSTDGFRLSLLGRTPFGRGLVRLEKEVKPAGAPFNGAGTMISPSWVDTGIGGSIFNELVGGLSDSTQYHWRIRLQYDSVSNPFLGNGRWIAVPWNGWQEADLRTPTILSAGSVPDGSVQPEQGLNVALQPNGDLTLSWGPSCAASDTDYEIYEGTLGNPASHTPRSCTTGGVTTVRLTPASGNKYYLVVPRNALREGSYGIRSDGFERPQGAGACLEQAVGTCQ